MFNNTQFRELIIRPTLDKLQMYSQDAVELLVFTCAVESNGGTYLQQIKGPALGIYQCEPATHQDIWTNYIGHRGSLVQMFSLNFNVQMGMDLNERLVYDLRYATAIARIHYRRVAEKLPNKDDVEAIYKYYKQYYNTAKGKSTKDKSIKLHESFIK